MKVAILTILALLAISGCIQQAPQATTQTELIESNPTFNQAQAPQETTQLDEPPIFIPQEVEQEPEQVEAKPTTYSLGEEAPFNNGLTVTVEEVVHIANCGDTGTCTGVRVKVQNKTENKLSDGFSGTTLLDGNGKQFSWEYTIHCPTQYDTGNIFPGGTKEGILCFQGTADTSKEVSVFISYNASDKEPLIYKIHPSEIQDLKQTISFSITGESVTFVQNSAGTVGSIGWVKYSLKNTGETIISDLTYDYELKLGSQTIEKGTGEIIALLDPQETDTGPLGFGYISIDEPGNYTLNIKVKYGESILAEVAHPIVVQS